MPTTFTPQQLEIAQQILQCRLRRWDLERELERACGAVFHNISTPLDGLCACLDSPASVTLEHAREFLESLYRFNRVER